jgi:valyl-tRNA synthetase
LVASLQSDLPNEDYMLDKTFHPQEVEDRIYAAWEASGAFRCGRRPHAEPFCIVIPPPNVTGRLHIGHALNNTLQDVLARFERMRGKDVLWQPGMDHAGIATQLVVERQLAERQLSRTSMGRNAFIDRVWAWKAESGGAIGNQLRKLGASADWSRERFTMDEGLSKAVTKVFVELYRQGLIYKDKRLVNWDPRLQTAVSDLEVENIEMKGHLWYLRYPIADEPGRFIVVATTRPETMLGDTAVAVHPEDDRFRDLIGKMVRLPLTHRLIPIIADTHSDPEKGTGAVKITPGHDFNDFEVGKRNKLPLLNIFNKDATLNDDVPECYRGLDRFEARARILADLEALELVDHIEPITHSVPHDEKTKTVILEPLLTEQWYLNVGPLAEKAIKAVEDGRTRFVPENWTNIYFHWLRNIQPWCISRQLWWGHQIPAWYDEDGNVYVAESEEVAARLAAGKALQRDPDVLDTWFSSALWPFSTLGWPDETPELARYYPTSVLVTGFDIIFFWVARMMMMGLHFMNEVPFRTVFIHTRVLDEKGVKMSKTKGNVVDPLELIEKFGADALRFTLALAAGQGRDMRIGPNRVEVNRNFATKVWNASRFCEMNECITQPTFDPGVVKLTLNKWIISETRSAIENITNNLASLRFNDAAQAAYHFVWDLFCDWYLEFAKPILSGVQGKSGIDDLVARAETRATAAFVRDQIFKLLHPFMPFITEELWARTAEHGEPRKTLLIESAWPDVSQFTVADGAKVEMQWVIDLISGVRSVRAEMNVPATARVSLLLRRAQGETLERLERHRDTIMSLARLSTIDVCTEIPSGSAQFVIGETIAGLPLGNIIDVAKERARLERELKKADDEIMRLDDKLSNSQFVSRAPEDVLTEQRERRGETARLADRLREAIRRLS